MGRQDSNLRVGDSESPAVPLGYFPNTLVGRVGFEPTAFRLKGESTSTGGTGPNLVARQRIELRLFPVCWTGAVTRLQAG